MPPLLKRILLNGLLTAGVLAVIGFGYAELAGLFLTARAPDRPVVESAAAVQPDHLAESIQTNVPVMMAVWGFLFIAVGEVVMHQIRKRRPVAPPPEPQPDPALVLLEEILAKVEAERATAPSPSPAVPAVALFDAPQPASTAPSPAESTVPSNSSATETNVDYEAAEKHGHWW
jgi:hypothetical protein